MGMTFVTSHYVSAEYHKNHPHLFHVHENELELLYIVDGDGPYIVDKKEYFVTPGTLVICNAGILHGESPLQLKGKESYCCTLTDVQMEGLPPNTLTERSANPILFFENDAKALGQIYRALHYFASQKGHEAICADLAGSILKKTLQELQRRETQISEQDKSEMEFVRCITDYLDNHYADNISIEDLSEKFHISPYYLFRFFKKGTGIAPMKYIMIRRIGEAQNLLMNTDIPIGDIGWQIGFEETAYFSRQFKHYVGITPTEFRAYHKKNRSNQNKQEQE